MPIWPIIALQRLSKRLVQDIAGRQRTLIQRLAKGILLLSQGAGGCPCWCPSWLAMATVSIERYIDAPERVYPMESNVFDVVSLTSSSSRCPLSPVPCTRSKD